MLFRSQRQHECQQGHLPIWLVMPLLAFVLALGIGGGYLLALRLTHPCPLQAQNQRQQRLLDLVAQLETPAILLAKGVLLAPVVGPIDDQRAQSFVGRLLEAASLQRARLVIIDIAGASNVDSRAAALLGQAVQALRLIGCRVAISGISAELAHTLVTAGISFDGVPTVRTPREAIEHYQMLIELS